MVRDKMQPTESYLKELLFTYDCVTIPGLGGFIMQSEPASVNRQKSRIYPPSRYPSFNSLLNHDDGLLISRIASSEKITYREAAGLVSVFAENCKKRIIHGDSVYLESIGELSSDPEGGIRFRRLNTANFDTGIYGMEAVNLFALKAHAKTYRAVKPADRKPAQFRVKKPASVRWTLAVSIPVIIFLLYGIIFPASFRNVYTTYSGIVSDFLHPGQANQVDAVILQKEKITPSPYNSFIETPRPQPVVETQPAAVKPDKPRYYIIGGCFENEGNARKFLASLLRQGYDAEEAGRTGRGHLRISYKSFPDKATALPYLEKIRKEENSGAWLLKY